MEARVDEELFPVVDISLLVEKYNCLHDWKAEEFQNDPAVKELVSEVSYGFTKWGFLYIKGHGIPQEEIENTFKNSKEFFLEDRSTKCSLQRDTGISLGYVPHDGEIFDYNKPNDIKEALDFLPESELAEKLNKLVPSAVLSAGSLFGKCKILIQKFLTLLAMALDLDMEHFVSMHRNIGDHSHNGSTMRLLYYPEIKRNADIQTDQYRCGEHTDYGTMTLLFQDSVGGLEVKSPSGQYIKAVPIPGTIVINAADLLHSWSGGKFKATLHRVVPPSDGNCSSVARQSIAFFTHPDYSVNIEYKDDDGQVRYRNAHDHLKARFDQTIVKVK